VVCGVVLDDNKLFLAQRGPGGPHAGLWEFPGGKVENDESPEQALLREFSEELNCDIEILGPLPAVSGERIELLPYLAQFLSPPEKIQHQQLCWASFSEAMELPMPPCDREVVSKLLKRGL
jgi:8-oxo-dGTP diphosphatase